MARTIPKTEVPSHDGLVFRSFTKASNILLHTDDIKSVYSVLLICLNLKEVPQGSRGFFGSLNKSYQFSFPLSTAVSTLTDLEITSDMNTSRVSIRYTMDESLAHQLMTIFMTAKLLHAPADRTRNRPRDKVLLQPTPKGVSILQRYAKSIGLKRVPPILLSPLNSMELFIFERKPSTDSIVYSDYLIQILFMKLMGSSPNVWQPSNSDDPLPPLSKLLEYSSNAFSFENTDFTEYRFGSLAPENSEEGMSWCDGIDPSVLGDRHRKSPLAHRFFTNPESDAHVQYYTSSVGVRMSHSKLFGKNKTIIEYSFTTKAVWQWLMDCTDIIYPREAVVVAALLLKVGLIVPILLPPSQNVVGKFSIARSSYYTLTKLGWHMVRWTTTAGSSPLFRLQTPRRSTIDMDLALRGARRDTLANLRNGENDDEHTLTLDSKDTHDNCGGSNERFGLDRILADPGMRYLFRLHLEREFCVENLDVYMEIRKFLKRMAFLKTLIDLKLQRKGAKKRENLINSDLNNALMEEADECLALAYQIYCSYIMTGAPYQVNIDHALREAISNVMMHPQSPYAESFKAEFGRLSLNSPVAVANSRSVPRPSPLQPPKGETPQSLGDIPILTPPVGMTSQNSPHWGTKTTKRCLGDGFKREFRPAPLNLNIQRDRNPSDEGNKLKVSNSYLLDTVTLPKSEGTLDGTIGTLRDLYPLFECVSNRMYKLMRSDSFQKFQASATFAEVVSLIAEEK